MKIPNGADYAALCGTALQEDQKSLMTCHVVLQRLAADDTMYYDSAWANPRSLKNQFSGMGDVRLS